MPRKATETAGPRKTAKRKAASKKTAKRIAKKITRKSQAAAPCSEPAAPLPTRQDEPAAAPQQIATAEGGKTPIRLSDLQRSGPPGIVCPHCHCRQWNTEDGKPWAVTHTERKFGFIRRRRVCRNCGHVVNTRETIDAAG